MRFLDFHLRSEKMTSKVQGSTTLGGQKIEKNFFVDFLTFFYRIGWGNVLTDAKTLFLVFLLIKTWKIIFFPNDGLFSLFPAPHHSISTYTDH